MRPLATSTVATCSFEACHIAFRNFFLRFRKFGNYPKIFLRSSSEVLKIGLRTVLFCQLNYQQAVSGVCVCVCRVESSFIADWTTSHVDCASRQTATRSDIALRSSSCLTALTHQICFSLRSY